MKNNYRIRMMEGEKYIYVKYGRKILMVQKNEGEDKKRGRNIYIVILITMKIMIHLFI